MARAVFIGSVILCLLCIGLSQIPDPSIFGIRDEPGHILFYGGSGLLAGFSGLLALLSGIYLGMTRSASLSMGQRRVMLITLLLVMGAFVIALTIRLLPTR